jgi:hypothetical protein
VDCGAIPVQKTVLEQQFGTFWLGNGLRLSQSLLDVGKTDGFSLVFLNSSGDNNHNVNGSFNQFRSFFIFNRQLVLGHILAHIHALH